MTQNQATDENVAKRAQDRITSDEVESLRSAFNETNMDRSQAMAEGRLDQLKAENAVLKSQTVLNQAKSYFWNTVADTINLVGAEFVTSLRQKNESTKPSRRP